MYNLTPNTLFIGKKNHVLNECVSTNLYAHQIVCKNEAIEGETIICNNQIGGRGQKGNTWESEADKNLTFSVILTPKFLTISDQFHLNIIISLSIVNVLNIFLKQKAVIKWPNDVLINKRKISGILIENILIGKTIKNSIIGVGLNVNQLNFSNLAATSIAIETGESKDLNEILNLILEEIERNYLQLKQGKLPILHFKYLENLYGLNEFLKFKDSNGDFIGKIRGIDPIGRLKVEKDNVEQTYNLQEIKFL